MDFYQLLVENKELLKVAYALIITFICAVIVLKTNKFFKISNHEGIRYFRNAFLFYGIAFFVRYFLGVVFYEFASYAFFISIFEYFMVLGGFFLLYSLIWKKFASEYSSLFNLKAIVFYLGALIIVLLNLLFETYNFMFYSQIILFFIVSIIAYTNYAKNPKRKFLKFYFIAMVLELITWIINLLTATLFSFNRVILLGLGVVNMIIFLVILYGVMRVTKK
jgi:hypothetical protein